MRAVQESCIRIMLQVILSNPRPPLHVTLVRQRSTLNKRLLFLYCRTEQYRLLLLQGWFTLVYRSIYVSIVTSQAIFPIFLHAAIAWVATSWDVDTTGKALKIFFSKHAFLIKSSSWDKTDRNINSLRKLKESSYCVTAFAVKLMSYCMMPLRLSLRL